ncbi:MAG: bifunctional hydroxymethylpyrimidine kinase/phosphomethylpyrimidine kinase [Pseudomonadota bacterium]
MDARVAQTTTPIALTIAGSDSGGGAGIQADLKAFSALGVYGASVITALTAQNTRAVTAVEGVSPKMIRAQIDAVFDDLPVSAVKIGMLAVPEIIEAVADGLSDHTIPVVLDPVMVAKSGAVLLEPEAISALVERLVPLARVVTPNLPEAAQILGTTSAGSVSAMQTQGEALLAKGAQAVLMKGGHGQEAVCTDLLIQPGADPLSFTSDRIETQNTHGTGCTLSSAIAAGLAKGETLERAVGTAHTYLNRAILAADQLQIGSGHGPVHHFHALWSRE